MVQSAQATCWQATEAAATLGTVLPDKHGSTNNVAVGLAMYEKIRKERATRVRQANDGATKNLNGRIGFTNAS